MKRQGLRELIATSGLGNISINETPAADSSWAYATAATSVCAFGVLSSILSMCTVWRKLLSEKNVFFALMFLVGGIDLTFNIAYVIFRWAGEETLVSIICEGLAFSASLAADLCTMALTAHRYFALKWPHKELGKKPKLVVMAFAAFGTLLLSITRFHFTLEESALALYIPVWFIRCYKSVILLYISTLSNMGLPFLLLILMIFFSIHIVLVITNRRPRSKITQQLQLPIRDSAVLPPTEQTDSVSATNVAPSFPGRLTISSDRHRAVSAPLSVVERIQQQQRREKENQAKSVISLVLFLDALFILNQLGYCIYTIATISRSYFPESATVEQWVWASDMVSDMFECLSHSLNFYFYVKFSKMMKHEFIDFLLRVKKSLGCAKAR